MVYAVRVTTIVSESALGISNRRHLIFLKKQVNWVYKVYNNLRANKRQRSSPRLASARSCSCWWSSGAQDRIPVPSSQPLVGASLELSLTKSLLASLQEHMESAVCWGRAENGAKTSRQGREVPALLGRKDGRRGQGRHTLRFLAQREGG